jgi:hypothetical protein
MGVAPALITKNSFGGAAPIEGTPVIKHQLRIAIALGLSLVGNGAFA